MKKIGLIIFVFIVGTTVMSSLFFQYKNIDFLEIGNRSSTPQNFKVAFIADQGLGENSRKVLELIKKEGTNMVLHQGDFDYEDNPDAWDRQINEFLGEDFPYFASIGNHDVTAWERYKKKLEERLKRIEGAQCVGDLGVKSACKYKGIFFILSGVDIEEKRHDEYINEQLANDNSIWRICSWHKNQRLMQVGHKGDETGWKVYEECRKGGAIIATGHEHSYSRTYLMGDFSRQIIASKSNILRIEKGKSFAFVSALGGESIRYPNEDLAKKEWWAAIYTAAQNANYGALFCTFNEDNVENVAHCYFKDIDGKIADEFYIVNNLN